MGKTIVATVEPMKVGQRSVGIEIRRNGEKQFHDIPMVVLRKATEAEYKASCEAEDGAWEPGEFERDQANGYVHYYEVSID